VYNTLNLFLQRSLKVIKQSELTKEQYTIGEVAAFLNINVKTIQRWDREGIFKCERTHTNRRVINRDNLIEVLNNRGMLFNDINNSKVDVIYARVSSPEQKAKGDLDRQVSFLVQSVKDLKNPIILAEVGSGLNDKREKLHQLLDMVLQDRVDRIFITYRDRLTRFGFYCLEQVCNYHNVKIIIAKDASEEKSVQKELTEDMMALTAYFSGKNLQDIKLDDENFNISEIFE
jgi:DNA binding domain, excisionase family